MKVACTHCETVADEAVTFGWLRLDEFGHAVGHVDYVAPEGLFCGPGCVVSHLERVMARAT